MQSRGLPVRHKGTFEYLFKMRQKHTCIFNLISGQVDESYRQIKLILQFENVETPLSFENVEGFNIVEAPLSSAAYWLFSRAMISWGERASDWSSRTNNISKLIFQRQNKFCPNIMWMHQLEVKPGLAECSFPQLLHGKDSTGRTPRSLP